MKFGFRISPGLLLAAALLLASAAQGSPRSDGWNLHKQGRNAEALTLLQQAAKENPQDAKTQWFLTLVLDAMGRPQEALRALQQAKRIDPALSFGSSPDSVEKKERGLAQRAGSGGTNHQPSNPAPRERLQFGPGFSQEEMVRALEQTGVFVAPSMRNSVVADDTVKATIGRNRAVKVLVVDELPPQAKGSAPSLAGAMYRYLNLGTGLMIVISNRPRQLGLFGAGLDGPTLSLIARDAARIFDAEGVPGGVAHIVRAVDEQSSRQARDGGYILLGIIGVPAVLIGWGVRRRKQRRVVELAAQRQQARDTVTRLAPEMERLSSDYEYALVGERDATRKQLLEEHQDRASEAFSKAVKRVEAAQSAQELTLVTQALQRAEGEMRRARDVLEGKIVPDASIPPALGGLAGSDEVPPLGANLPGALPGYALDFFTSQPILQSEMVPVEIEVNGQRRRVWASRESAQAAMSGQPQVATLPLNGAQRPWFEAAGYNPWYDFGSTAMQMIAWNMMFNAMTPHYSGGGFGNSFGNGTVSDFGGTSNDFNRDFGSSTRDESYDNRMDDAVRDAGGASLNSPMHGGGSWFNNSSSDSDSGGGASLDVFSSGSSSSSDSS